MTANSKTELSRRGLLKTAAGAALLIGFDIPQLARAQEPKKSAEAVNPIRAWLRVDGDGSVTILCSKSEMGQGISTALPMVLADELGVEWQNVRVEQALTNAALYGDQGTGGSGSVAAMWVPMRQAGAAAREMLVTAAAQRWGVSPKDCRAAQGAVTHDGKTLRYGELVEDAAKLPVPALDKVVLKKPGDFQLIGKSQPRKDIPAKVDGSAQFGLDVRVPGMLYAMVVRCPVFGGKVRSFRAEKAKALPGVHDVFEIEAVPVAIHSWGGVAVVAESTYTAMKARKLLDITWDEGPHAAESSESLRKDFRRIVDSPMKTVIARGNFDEAINAAAPGKKVEADYELPFQAHATMEPMNCTMHITPEHAEAWAPVQSPGWVVDVIGQVTHLPPEKITVHTTLMGGGFGRRYQADFAMEAAQIAHKIGKPVQLVWTREDDMTHDFYRPASYHRMTGAVDSNGEITGWRHRSTSTPISEWWDPKANPESSELGMTFQMPYLMKSYKLEFAPAPSGVPRAWWRSVEASSIAFVVESYVDELAHAAGMDPYEFRVRKLEGDRKVKSPVDPNQVPLETARMLNVLKMAADKGEWGKALPAGHGRGIACHFCFNSYAANVVEVKVDKGALRVVRVVSAVDIGTVVNPDGVTAQVESAIVYGLTAALKSQITIQNGRAMQTNFNRFSTLMMNETPSIEVHMMPSELIPTGIGEPALPPVAPAMAGAIFSATSKRIRRLPVLPADLA